MKRRGGSVLLPSLLLVPSMALGVGEGQDAQTDEPAVTLKEHLVVTATRIEQPLPEVPVNVTVLDSEELERSASLTIDDTLRRVPGFSLFRRASSLVAHPTSQGVSLRGIGPSGVSRTLVLLDGLPLNDAFGGWVYWSRVPEEPLERVEIVRGGSSSVWGNYALGGVIQLITAESDDRFVRLLGDLGERSTLRVDASAGWRLGSRHLTLRGSYFDTDGYFTLRPDQRGEIDVPANSEHGNLAGRLRFGLGSSFDLSLRADTFDEDRSNGTRLTGNDTEATFVAVVGSRVGERGGELSFSLAWSGQDFASTFSAQEEDRSSERPALDQFLVDSESLGLSAQWTRGVGANGSTHRLGLGADLRVIDGATNELFRNLGAGFTRSRFAAGEEQLGGLFVQDNIAAGSRWQINLGVRLDRWQSRDGVRLETSLEDGSPVRDESFADRDQTELSPKVAVLFAASDRLQLQGSVYRSFRAPTINELYRPFRVRNDITEANAALLPEELEGAEMGLRYGNGGSTFHLTGFWNEVQDPIANVTLALGPGVIQPCGFVPGGGSCRQRQNLETTRIRGVEAELRVRPAASPWSFSLSYLYSDPEVKRAPSQPSLEGKRIAQVPQDQLVGRLEYLGRRFASALQVRFIGDQFDDDLNERVLEEATVVDLYFSRDLSARWQIFAAVENAFDEEVEVARTATGLVTVGGPRLVHGGVRLRWQ